MIKLWGIAFLACSLFLLGAASLRAAPPLHKDGGYQHPDGFKPCRTMDAPALRALQMKGGVRSAGSPGLMTAATQYILVIPVQFPGGPTLPAGYRAEASTFFSSMRDFFYENSYTLYTVSATIVDSITLPSSVAYYNRETDADLLRLFSDATASVPAPPNGYSSYDYLMIYHAGPGEEETRRSADLWSLYYPGSLNSGGTGAKSFSGFTVVPASVTSSGYSQLGVICHEFGHQLGLPDLYDTTTGGGVSTVGAWSLMDWPYGKDSSGHPPHLDAWSKYVLRYVDLPAREITERTAGAFGDIETSQATGYYKIPIDVAGSSEYFIAEYRNPDAARMHFDLTAPGNGIVIWHVDDAIARDPVRLDRNDINSGRPHPGVALVPADRVFVKPGDAGDTWRTGDAFTVPDSNAFSGEPTGIAVADIVLSGAYAAASIMKIAVRPDTRFDRLVNYPNPAGRGYPHPRSGAGTVTTIAMQLTRPPRALVLDIYTLAGERVVSLPDGSLDLKLSKSSDNAWVYEYDWDGKNESGHTVAPGIYLYRVKADDVVKAGKLAIVR